MDLIKEMSDSFIILIRVGAVMRVVYCLVKIGANDEEAGAYKKRAWNTVGFYVFAEMIWEIKEMVLVYYG